MVTHTHAQTHEKRNCITLNQFGGPKRSLTFTHTKNFLQLLIQAKKEIKVDDYGVTGFLTGASLHWRSRRRRRPICALRTVHHSDLSI